MAAVTLATLSWLVFASPANGTFPGKNGRIAYSLKVAGAKADIYSVNRKGGDRVQLTATPRGDVDPSFSADGSRIVYVGTTDAGATELFEIPAAGGAPTQLTTLPDLFKRDPAFSPSGDRIVFAASAAGSADIWIANRDGTAAEALISGAGDESDPSFSPDGTKIVFTRRPEGGGRQNVFLANADGTAVTNLTAGYKPGEKPKFLDFQDPSFSPDGRHIAIATNYRNRGRFVLDPFVMRSDGSRLRPVIRSPGFEIEPVFSPDGNRIAFARYGGEKSVLLTVLLDGSRLRKVAKLTNHISSGEADWQALASPYLPVSRQR